MLKVSLTESGPVPRQHLRHNLRHASYSSASIAEFVPWQVLAEKVKKNVSERDLPLDLSLMINQIVKPRHPKKLTYQFHLRHSSSPSPNFQPHSCVPLQGQPDKESQRVEVLRVRNQWCRRERSQYHGMRGRFEVWCRGQQFRDCGCAPMQTALWQISVRNNNNYHLKKKQRTSWTPMSATSWIEKPDADLSLSERDFPKSSIAKYSKCPKWLYPYNFCIAGWPYNSLKIFASYFKSVRFNFKDALDFFNA